MLGSRAEGVTAFRAAYGTDHDPSDRLGRFYLAAILLCEKLLWFDPASREGSWAIRRVKEILEGFRGTST
jgi:hypothetical protein